MPHTAAARTATRERDVVVTSATLLVVVTYQLARDERLGEAALPALALVGLLPVRAAQPHAAVKVSATSQAGHQALALM